jgi:pimeloyl-ACP methyl ester carboxylesterase
VERGVVSAIFTITLALAAGVSAQETDPAVEDPPVVDAQYPAAARLVAIPSGDARMNGVLFLAQGVGPHPNAVVLHGFPGSTKNEDLAYAIQRAGWNVLTFQYRGSWGSEGEFSWSGALDDVSAAIAFTGSPNGAGDRGLPDQVVVIGHSFGGWAALMTAASHPKVRAVASIAGANIGLAGRNLRDYPERYTALRNRMEADMLAVRGTSPDELLQDLMAHSEEWDLTRHVSALGRKSVLLIGGERDTAARLAEHHVPLVEALQQERAPQMTAIVLDADHAFSDKRIALARTVISWLVGLKVP